MVAGRGREDGLVVALHWMVLCRSGESSMDR